LVDPNGIVSIDLASGAIDIDVAAATAAGSLNGLGANTQLLDGTTLGNVTQAISAALGTVTSKVTEGVTEVLNNTAVTLSLDATLSAVLTSVDAGIEGSTTLGQLAGTAEGDPTVEFEADGGVIDD